MSEDEMEVPAHVGDTEDQAEDSLVENDTEEDNEEDNGAEEDYFGDATGKFCLRILFSVIYCF